MQPEKRPRSHNGGTSTTWLTVCRKAAEEFCCRVCFFPHISFSWLPDVSISADEIRFVITEERTLKLPQN